MLEKIGTARGDFCQALLRGSCRHIFLHRDLGMCSGWGCLWRCCAPCVSVTHSVGARPWPGAPTQAPGLPSTFLSLFCLPFTLPVYAQMPECKTTLSSKGFCVQYHAGSRGEQGIVCAPQDGLPTVTALKAIEKSPASLV